MKAGELKRKLKMINNHFNKIDKILSDLPNDIQMEIQEYHNENYGLLHCTRWGVQGSEELVKDVKKIIKRTHY